MKTTGILPDNLHDDMSDSITRLTEVYEEVDNLALTVIPFAYLQATRLTQLLFCLALPFVVFEQQDVRAWHMVAFSPLILMIKCAALLPLPVSSLIVSSCLIMRILVK